MTPDLRAELENALRGNDGQLGKVFALLEEGKVTNRELAEGGGAANPGAAANLRVTVKAVLDGVLPKGPTVAAQARRGIGVDAIDHEADHKVLSNLIERGFGHPWGEVL